MAHAAAHLKKARELEQHPEYRALQKARERRRRQRERAKRQVKQNHIHKFVSCTMLTNIFIPTTHAPVGLRVRIL